MGNVTFDTKNYTGVFDRFNIYGIAVYNNLISSNINVQNPLEFLLTIHLYC